jgi:hypothetical protein
MQKSNILEFLSCTTKKICATVEVDANGLAFSKNSIILLEDALTGLVNVFGWSGNSSMNSAPCRRSMRF